MVQGESERSLLQNSEAPTGVGSHGGRPTVGAMSPSMHVGSARAYFAVYHRVPLRENLREKEKCTFGPNSPLREKKKCTPGPNSPQGEKRRLDGAGGPPRGVPEAYVEGGLPFGTGRTKVYTWPPLSSGRVR